MTSKDQLRLLIASDVWRSVGGRGIKAFLKAWFLDPTFRPIFTMRLCTYCHKKNFFLKIVYLLFWFFHQRYRLRACVDIAPTMRIGRGFKLLHGLGVVVNSDAIIGSNVTIMQGVTIGGTSAGVPIVEDDVIICANASVLGNVVLGRGCVIGAGAVVLTNVPSGFNAVGNPARVIPRRNPPKGFNDLPADLR